jgi:hypothetical protein
MPMYPVTHPFLSVLPNQHHAQQTDAVTQRAFVDMLHIYISINTYNLKSSNSLRTQFIAVYPGHNYTGLLQMIIRVLTTCHTQYT